MKRLNAALIISLAVHILMAIIFTRMYMEGAVRKGFRGIPVELNVEAPQPRLETQKPKFKPIDLSQPQRTSNRQQTIRLVKIDKKMDKSTAYRDIIVTDDSDAPPDMEMSDDGLQTGGDFSFGSGARGAGDRLKGGKSQLVEFVDKSRGKRRIVYCLDVSASMGAANKLNLARNYLKDSLFALDRKKDDFNVIVFATNVSVFQPGNLIPATEENLIAAMNFLDEYTPQSIMANKKTDLLAPLTRALGMKPSIIALVTDGLPTAGVTNPEIILQSIKEKNTDGNVRIFAIGMEMDPEQPEAWLLRAIAGQNRGEFQFF